MNKKVIIGKWIFKENKMIADSNCGIIESMIKNEFIKLKSSEDGWTTRYKSNEGEIWELSYPENHLQGGGPPKLIQIKLLLEKMKLESKCKNCGKYIEFTENVSDRAELSLEKGENIELFCKKCSTKSCHHPNDINAKKNRVISIIGFLIFVIGTILIYHFIGEFYLEHKEQFESKKNFSSFGKLLGAFAIPFIIFQLIENIQMRKVRRFNSYKIKD